ncbi:aliphatic sulfonates family ABC transporter, periplsmic ligand-binding protein [Methylocella silvestris BL2]|uniref:Putative aliphatic sulfonates-binding protein n=1 Tax=Methylocella silvestris (strain DSM 15510 / CIP 108128 / LMG 27833 / NCIMB 13906 / BL2) TaxID=395965 RepID=B8EJY9_METSB|nr:aliphatic sulfonate ABC transporter substrate-binding protein [Methylocella silvestris]ACK49936.1 aliphatic sulfonates family ABC transporter, periplsmic ligand-binding protein [Methylocella silvestris BL2]
MHRRHFLSAALGGAIAALAIEAKAAELKEIRIGFQKAGVLFAFKQRRTLEIAFEPQNIAIKWIEFPFGPPILEALATGSVDFGFTGDAPPIFSQAAGADLLYVAALPRNSIEGIVVRADSAIRAIADLKGKAIAIPKGSSAHNMTIAALETVGLSFNDIKPVYLAPADGFAAFSRGSVDAWTIWDPYFALAQKAGARVVALNTEVEQPSQFFLAAKSFAQAHPQTLTKLIDVFARELAWARAHRPELAQAIHDATGIDQEAILKAVQRADLDVVPLNEQIVANQQAAADRFFRAGLIPKQIAVRDIIWTWTPSS